MAADFFRVQIVQHFKKRAGNGRNYFSWLKSAMVPFRFLIFGSAVWSDEVTAM